jgi:hypothetical protein
MKFVLLNKRLFAFLITFLFAWNSHAVSISELKGAYLINFIKFARFEVAIDKIEVCIHKEKEILQFLEEKAPKEVSNIKVNIKDLSELNEIDHCNIVFIPNYNLYNSFREKPLLILTDEGGGGAVEFIEINEKLKFAINMRKIAESNITFPVQVLQLAIQRDNVSLFDKSLLDSRFAKNSDIYNTHETSIFAPSWLTLRNQA